MKKPVKKRAKGLRKINFTEFAPGFRSGLFDPRLQSYKRPAGSALGVNTLKYLEDYNLRLTQILGKLTVFVQALVTYPIVKVIVNK